ncbi:NapC/NirT family cytochrome c [Afifella sp. IM 167]|uniref:NapC/NirT family cytochrome c n=1 Tax=Afifella sp. IM 167 TaxID=2033586 RepID=UPI001CCB3FAE|nr:NapC/NirT family cytochrome c [Afifella sp. IM 167]MBZ8134833.1 hypothetical protein [Afifella sp. IM 167]
MGRGAWIGVLVLGGVLGLAAAGVTTEVVQRTGTNEFCVACHEMSWPQETYEKQVHFSNPVGVRVPCIACHVDEHPWYDLLLGKASAGARDVWGHLTGKLSTREAYEAQRAELSQRVIDQLTASDSATCRNCHSFAAMAFDKQTEAAKATHPQAEQAGVTCITCHQDIGHAPAESAAAEPQDAARLAEHLSRVQASAD